MVTIIDPPVMANCATPKPSNGFTASHLNFAPTRKRRPLILRRNSPTVTPIPESARLRRLRLLDGCSSVGIGVVEAGVWETGDESIVGIRYNAGLEAIFRCASASCRRSTLPADARPTGRFTPRRAPQARL